MLKHQAPKNALRCGSYVTTLAWFHHKEPETSPVLICFGGRTKKFGAVEHPHGVERLRTAMGSMGYPLDAQWGPLCFGKNSWPLKRELRAGFYEYSMANPYGYDLGAIYNAMPASKKKENQIHFLLLKKLMVGLVCFNVPSVTCFQRRWQITK